MGCCYTDSNFQGLIIWDWTNGVVVIDAIKFVQNSKEKLAAAAEKQRNVVDDKVSSTNEPFQEAEAQETEHQQKTNNGIF
jgi:hypothetical protein